ncbi:hypothetical protein KFE25_001738 [Diacronema lutheri]|uniref:Uncharacterized protein n=1 Tax=Diacronema lutheri TaxID=2081491 RepID=A0A8J6CAU0_DIALT|nr:hypothetical protein KFE25_001738 [Diacronema lutheri]
MQADAREAMLTKARQRGEKHLDEEGVSGAARGAALTRLEERLQGLDTRLARKNLTKAKDDAFGGWRRTLTGGGALAPFAGAAVEAPAAPAATSAAAPRAGATSRADAATATGGSLACADQFARRVAAEHFAAQDDTVQWALVDHICEMAITSDGGLPIDLLQFMLCAASDTDAGVDYRPGGKLPTSFTRLAATEIFDRGHYAMLLVLRGQDGRVVCAYLADSARATAAGTGAAARGALSNAGYLHGPKRIAYRQEPGTCGLCVAAGFLALAVAHQRVTAETLPDIFCAGVDDANKICAGLLSPVLRAASTTGKATAASNGPPAESMVPASALEVLCGRKGDKAKALDKLTAWASAATLCAASSRKRAVDIGAPTKQKRAR